MNSLGVFASASKMTASFAPPVKVIIQTNRTFTKISQSHNGHSLHFQHHQSRFHTLSDPLSCAPPSALAINVSTHLPEPHGIRTSTLSIIRSPNRLLPHIRPFVRGIDHNAGLHKDRNMHNMVDTVPAFAPKQHIPRLGVCARDMLAH